MSTRTLLNATDTFVRAAEPSKSFSRVSFLEVSSTAFGYLYFTLPFTKGATIVSATLTLTSYSAAAASRTMRVGLASGRQTYSTMTWDSKPPVVAPFASVSSSAAAGGQKWVFDVAPLLQAVSSGQSWWGFRVDTTAASGLRFDSCQSPYQDRRPMLRVEWADEPDQPIDLSPEGGLAVSSAKPTLRFTYGDYGGSTTLRAVRVQFSPTASFSTVTWDSGTVLTGVPELDLAQTSFPGLTASKSYWRVIVQDSAALWSKWSDAAATRFVDRGIVTLTQPAGDVIMDATPAVQWDFTGTQAQYEIVVYRGDKVRTPVYSSGIRTSGSQATFVPSGVLRDDKTYTITVRVWDDVEREAVPGSPDYRQVSRTVWFDDDLATPAPTTATAMQVGVSPFVDVQWSVANQPDYFQLVRDGVVLGQWTPAEVRLDGQNYIFRDRTAPPLTQVRYHVRSIVAGKRSKPRAATSRPKVVGVWLTTPTESVCLSGTEEGSPTLGEISTVHEVGGRVVVITDSLRGHEGDWSGELHSDLTCAPGVSAKEHRDALMRIRSNPEGARLHMGPVNVPVSLAQINVRATSREELSYMASFSYWQDEGPELDDLDETG